MYKKIYKDGILQNPVTKDNPFVNDAKVEKFPKQRRMNNTKGVRCIVSKIGVFSFLRYRTIRQTVGNKQIEHLQCVS